MKFLKSLSSYTLITFLSGATSFLLAPVLTHFLLPEDYALIGLIVTYMAVFLPFASFNTSAYLGLELTDPDKPYGSLLKTLLLFHIFSFSLFLVFVLWQADWLKDVLELPEYALLLLMALAFFTALSELYQVFLIYKQRESQYVKVFGLKILLEVGVVLLLIVALKTGWEGRIYGTLVAFGFVLVLFLYNEWSQLKNASVSWGLLRSSLLYGAPLIPHVLNKLALSQADRIFIVKYDTYEELGIYSLAYVVGSSVMYFSSAFLNVYSPFVFRKLRALKDNDRRELGAMFYLFLILTLIVCVLVIILSPLAFKYVFDEQYYAGLRYVPVVVMGYFFWTVYLSISPHFFYHKRTALVSTITFIAMALNIALNFWLVPLYGGMGAAYATLCSFFVMAALAFLMASRLLPYFTLQFANFHFKDFRSLMNSFNSDEK